MIRSGRLKREVWGEHIVEVLHVLSSRRCARRLMAVRLRSGLGGRRRGSRKPQSASYGPPPRQPQHRILCDPEADLLPSAPHDHPSAPRRLAALASSPPEIVAAQNSIAPGSNVTAGNLAAVPPPPDFGGVPFPLNSTTSPALQDLLSTLTPLPSFEEFGNSRCDAALRPQCRHLSIRRRGVELGRSRTGLTAPDTVFFFYDDLFRVAQAFTKGQIVAKFSFPLTVLNSNGTENPAVMTTLKSLPRERPGQPLYRERYRRLLRH